MCARCTGLGEVEAAKQVLKSSQAVLMGEFGAEFEAIGEARYYLTLAELHSVPAPDVQQHNGALKHVC